MPTHVICTWYSEFKDNYNRLSVTLEAAHYSPHLPQSVGSRVPIAYKRAIQLKVNGTFQAVKSGSSFF